MPYPASSHAPYTGCGGKRMKSRLRRSRKCRVKSKRNTHMKKWRSRRYPMRRRRQSCRKRTRQRGGMMGGNPITYAGEYLSRNPPAYYRG